MENDQMELFPCKKHDKNKQTKQCELSCDFVYLIESNDGKVKIGRSVDPHNRIKNIKNIGGIVVMQTYVFGPMKLASIAEGYMHKYFCRNRLVGEWFNISFDNAKAVLQKKRWEGPRYFELINRKEREPLHSKQVEEWLKQLFPHTSLIEDKNLTTGFHCDSCMCPLDQWEPYRTYQSDRSCELHWLLDSIIELEKSKFTATMLAKKHRDEILQEFPDLADVLDTINEHLLIQSDLGVIERIDDEYFATTVGQTPVVGVSELPLLEMSGVTL